MARLDSHKTRHGWLKREASDPWSLGDACTRRDAVALRPPTDRCTPLDGVGEIASAALQILCSDHCKPPNSQPPTAPPEQAIQRRCVGRPQIRRQPTRR